VPPEAIGIRQKIRNTVQKAGKGTCEF